VFQDKARPAIVSKARFAGVQVKGEIWVVLDLANPKPKLHTVHLHLPAQDLVETSRSSAEVRYENIGAPIPVWDFLNLPDERRGFELLD
jgi:hypothetical protein